MHVRGAIAVAVAALAAGLAAPQRSGADEAGAFGYYVLALSWSPSWCATEGDKRGAAECTPGAGRSFTLHGLWPQHEAGWPEFCATAAPDPSRRETAAMADITGSGGLAWHQWQKHGRCSGLAGADYLALARRAYEGVTIPPVLAALDRDVRLPASVVEAAFLEVNPALAPDGITVTCDDGRIDEVRLCLTRTLAPRLCAPDVRRDCTLSGALMEAPR